MSLSTEGGGSADALTAVITLLSDPVALKAEYERLQAARDAAQAVVDLVGPASDILALRQKTADALAAQLVQQEAATESCDKLMADATGRARSILDQADTAKAEALDALGAAVLKIKDADAYAAQTRAAVLALKDALERDHTTLGDKLNAVEAREKALDDAEQERDKRVLAIQAALDSFRAALDALG